jgi:hypothetical protein
MNNKRKPAGKLPARMHAKVLAKKATPKKK